MVYELLSIGRERAKTGRELCKILDIKPRDLTEAIEQERRQGIPICANTGGRAAGYFLAADKAEMQAYCKSLYHRAGEIFKTRRACMRTLEHLPEPDTK